MIAQSWCAVLPSSNDDPVEDPNSIYNYMTPESVARLEERYASDLQISFDVNKVSYKLWTREGGFDKPFVFNHDTAPQQLLDNHFDPNRPTKVLAHGFCSDVGFAEPFAKAYIENFDHNVNIIGIDWGELSSSSGIPHYFIAANNAIKVGQHTGKLFADMLLKSLGVNTQLVHAIGHSLGAHVVGHFGRTIQTEGYDKIIRMTALDPAEPWYGQTKEENRMNKEDADFVDVIHTNSGGLLHGGLSFMENMGHIDFYPNGGNHQPGCTELCIGDWCFHGNNDGISLIDWFKGGCSHGRSHEFYVESIVSMVQESYPFMAEFCQDWEYFDNGICLHLQDNMIPMGEHARPPSINHQHEIGSLMSRKSFVNKIIPGLFLKTNKEEPFSLTH